MWDETNSLDFNEAAPYNWGSLGNIGSGQVHLNPTPAAMPAQTPYGESMWDTPQTPSYAPPTDFGVGLGSGQGDLLTGNNQQQSGWSLGNLFNQGKNYLQQQVGNTNLGDVAYKLGALYMNKRGQDARAVGINQGIQTMQQAQDPYLRQYQDRLFQMIQNPGDYGRTPYGTQVIKDATQAVRRGLAAQGRAGTVNETALAHQAAAGLLDKSYNNQVNTLSGLAKPNTQALSGLAQLYQNLGNIDASRNADTYNILGQIGMGTGVLPKPSTGLTPQQFETLVTALRNR